MPLITQISDDLKTAMKAKDEATLSTLRMLKSALKNKQIDLYGAEAKELSDDEVLVVIKTQIKQLKDAAETFKTGGRADMAESSTGEIAVLETYLPAQLDDATVASTVKAALAAAGITSRADAGKAMGVAMKSVAGKADAGRVKAAVESILVALVLTVIGFAAVPHQALAAADANFYATVGFIAYGLRIARVFTLVAGLVAVNNLLVGSFAYMTAGGREETSTHAHHQMTGGLLGTVIVAGLFIGFTVALNNLGAQ